MQIIIVEPFPSEFPIDSGAIRIISVCALVAIDTVVLLIVLDRS